MVRCIFSINPGRCGSHYLSILLSQVRNVIPHHEPEPKMQGLPLVLWNRGEQQQMRTLFYREKLPKIRDVLQKGYIYSETNNAFIKGFGYVVPEYFAHEEIAVITLQRDAEEIVNSLINLDLLPHKEKDEDAWMLRPDYPTNILKPSGTADRDYCSWYVAEVYERGKKFRQMFPKIRYIDIALEELNSSESVTKMISSLGLEPLDRIEELIGIPTNTRREFIP